MTFGLVKHNNNSISAITSAGQLTQGKMTLIKEQTADSASSVSFIHGSSSVVFDNTYPIYLIKVINAHLDTDDRNIVFNFTSDGTNFNVTKTTTNFRVTHQENGSNGAIAYRENADLAQSTSDQPLGEALLGGSSNADGSSCAELLIFNPSDTTFVKHFISQSIGMTAGQGAERVFVGGYCNTTSAITGIKFLTAGGSATTIDGTFKLYGIKGS
jgi:hypothetical protein